MDNFYKVAGVISMVAVVAIGTFKAGEYVGLSRHHADLVDMKNHLEIIDQEVVDIIDYLYDVEDTPCNGGVTA